MEHRVANSKASVQRAVVTTPESAKPVRRAYVLLGLAILGWVVVAGLCIAGAWMFHIMGFGLAPTHS